MSLHELNTIISSSNKLKESIYSNKIIHSATRDQEKAFYTMVYSIVNNTVNYIENNKEADHVKKTLDYFDFLSKENELSDVIYDYNLWKNKVEQIYKEESKDEEGNSVAAIEALIFWPVRLANEKLYRELTGSPFDETLDV